MRLFHYTLFIFVISTFSCNSPDYSEEEEAKLEEAQKIHNEAMATYAESKQLLAELTDVRSELRRRMGLETGGESASQESASQDTAAQNTSTGNTDQRNADENKNAANNTNNAQPNNSGTTSSGSTTSSADTATVNNETKNALDKLNQAQNDLLTWMRNIYTVPGLNEKNEGEKTKDPAIGMDFDSRRLTKDIQFKEYPEDTGIDEIYEKQKEMKEKIDQINEDMKKAIEEGKKAYLNK